MKYTYTDSPVGRLLLKRDNLGLTALLYTAGAHPQANVIGTDDELDEDAFDDVIVQLEQYFQGNRMHFDLPLHPSGTDFQLRAWQALTQIDYGKTATYAQQANALGQPRAVRAVGTANGRNPISIIVPCHRVIGSNGSLTGYGGGMTAKRWLLDLERRVAG